MSVKRVLWMSWLPVVLLVLWWVVSTTSKMFFFPPLPVILESFRANFLSPEVTVNLLPSLVNLAAGFALAVILGGLGGLLLGLNERAATFFAPAIHFFRSLPGPALLPLFIVLLGIGVMMKVWIIAFTAAFVMILNAMDGVLQRQPRWDDVCAVYHISRWRAFWNVIVPGAVPQLLAGARVALQTALLLMVVSEMIASTGGVGFLILQSQQQFRIPAMWAGIIMLGILGFLLNVLFNLAERRILRWRGAKPATDS